MGHSDHTEGASSKKRAAQDEEPLKVSKKQKKEKKKGKRRWGNGFQRKFPTSNRTRKEKSCKVWANKTLKNVRTAIFITLQMGVKGFSSSTSVFTLWLTNQVWCWTWSVKENPGFVKYEEKLKILRWNLRKNYYKLFVTAPQKVLMFCNITLFSIWLLG